MADGYLVRRLLDFDLLERDEAAALYLHHELSLSLILEAASAGAFDLRVELA